MKNQGILDFPTAKEIVQNETTYNEETYSFLYIGPEQE